MQTPDIQNADLFGAPPYGLYLKLEGIGPGDVLVVQGPVFGTDVSLTGSGQLEWYSTDIGWQWDASDINNSIFNQVDMAWTDASLPSFSYSDGHPDAFTDTTPDFPPGLLLLLKNGRDYLVFQRWTLHAGSGNAQLTTVWYPVSEIGLPPPPPPPPDPVEPPPAPPVAPPAGPRPTVPKIGPNWVRSYLVEDISRIQPPSSKVMPTAQPTGVVRTAADDSTVYYALSGAPSESVAQLQDVDGTFDEPQPISHNADPTTSAFRVRPSPNEQLVGILPGGDLAITFVAEDNSTTPFPMPKESIYPNWDSWQNFGPEDVAWLDDDTLAMTGFFTRDEVGQSLFLECARRSGWASEMTWELVPVDGQPFEHGRALAYHQETGLLALGDSEANIYLYRLMDGTLQLVEVCDESPMVFGAANVLDLAWNPAGDRLAVAVAGASVDDGLVVYSVVNDGLNVARQHLPGMGFMSRSCSFSHTGEYLAATSYYEVDGGGYPGTLPVVWRTSDWVEALVDDPENLLLTSLVTAWSPTEDRLLAVGEEQIAT